MDPLAGATINPGPAAGAANDPLAGATVGQSAAPHAVAAPSAASIPMAKPADTSGVFSKFTSFISGAAGNFSKAIQTPGVNTISKNPIIGTLQYLPSELARQVPGVADLQDNPELSKYITPGSVAKSVVPAALETAQGFAKAPITALADVWDVGRTFLGKDPNASFNIPGLGKVTSDVMNVAQAIKEGQDPVTAALSASASGIFNTLFFADIMNRVAGTRAVPVAQTTGDINTLPKAPGDTIFRPAVDVGPKSGRLYETPTAYNSGGAQVIPPQVLDTMKGQGIKLGSNFDPAQPVFFKVTLKGGQYTGTIIQLKPSYLETAYNKLFGTSGTTQTIPGLLSGAEAPQAQSAKPTDLARIADKAPAASTVTLHSQTIAGSDIVQAVNSGIASQKTPQLPAPAQPPQLPAPASHTVAHNVLRLAGGDTSKAKDGAQILLQNTKDSIKTHGDDATHQALTEQVGMGPEQASALIQEAKTPTSAAEIKAGHDKALAEIFGGRTDEQVKGDALAHVAANQDKLVQDYIAKHDNVVGADEAKELMPGYSQDRSISDLVQKGAGQLADAVYDHLLDTRQGERNNTVLITAGGTGAGKSTSIKDINTKEYPVILDTNLSHAKSGIERIQHALDQGFKVDLRFTYADIGKAYDRVLDRAHEMERRKGSGRPVSAQGHIDMHHGSHDALPEIIEHFKDNLRVRISLNDNSGMAPTQVDNPLDFINKIRDNREDANQLHTQLTQQRELAAHEGRISKKTNAGFTRAETLRPRREGKGPEISGRVQESGKKPPVSVLTGAPGFVNPAAAAEDIANATRKMQATIKHIEEVRQLTGNVREGIYQHENARKAVRVRFADMLQTVGTLLDAEGWEQLYHYDENKDEPLDERQKQIYDTFIAPLKRSLTDTISEYREAGGTITSDLFFMDEGEYTPRFAKDKQSALDKLLDKGKEKVKSIQNGGLLSKSLGTVGKSRKFYAATDESGARHVVYVPTNKSEPILQFKNGKPTELGPNEGSVTPKVKEFFDDSVMRKLNDLAASLGIAHERVATGKSKGLGSSTAGVTSPGSDLVKTRLSPGSVLAHEIGHQIDYKYGMQAVMKEDKYGTEHKSIINKEMRALADKRFEGMETSDHFKKYVRKGTEKMAVMFEAYVANRDMFRATAPHLYDDFRDFIASHDELRPFLDIEPSIQLGSETHGGVQSGKIGSKFVDKNGTPYKIGQATTKEIEANTKTEYHKNALANYTVALDRAINALGAMRLLERLQDENEFGTIIKKDNPDEAPPEGWKSVSDKLPQFRGYHMEPRTAEALEDLAKRQSGQLYIPVFDEINNFLTTMIVINPIMHVPNVISGRALAAAAGDISPKSLENFKTALDEVRNKGPLYLDYLEHGAPFMNLKEVTKNFADAVFTQYTQEVEDEPGEHEQIAKLLGYVNPAAMARGLGKINEAITWGSNDIFFMHAMMDYRDTHGGSMESAIREVSKRMADYRIPERILLPGSAGRALSIAAQSRAFMFGRFHYTGVVKPWLEAARDSAIGTAQERISGLRSLAYLLIMGLAIWPYINKMWQGVTGSPTSYETMPGPLRPIQVGQKFLQAGSPGVPAALQSVFSVSPAAKSAIELGFNTDLFTRNPVYGPLPADGWTNYGTSIISPLASASRMNPEDFALSMFGVWTPKNVPAQTTLNTMKYNELPALQTQVKKDMAAGNTEKANAEMREFNTRAIATWNQYELQIGGTNLVKTDAQVQDFLKQYGIKAPGAVALAHANALYGDGSLTNKSSLIANVVTYAKAIGVSPLEAFHLIFSGQTIARVENFGLFNPDSTIIVKRAPLSQTSAIKQAQQTAQGDASGAGLQLDHVIPLEGGGTNDERNLNLITTDQDGGEQQQFENVLGAAVKAGKISHVMVQEYSIRYKAGRGETLPAAMMQDFTTKYGGKPITLQEVKDAIDAGETK